MSHPVAVERRQVHRVVEGPVQIKLGVLWYDYCQRPLGGRLRDVDHVQIKLPYLDVGKRRFDGRLGVRKLGECAVIVAGQVLFR